MVVIRERNQHIALIDGDLIAYQVAASVQQTVNFDGQEAVIGDEDHARELVINRVLRLLRDVEAQDAIICLSDIDDNNFRKDLYAKYKANRAGKPKPVDLLACKAALMDKFPHKWYPYLEGDDVVAMMATRPVSQPKYRTIISEDKDFQCIPGKHYNPNTRKFFEVTKGSAAWYHLCQTLVGDASDGYPGCPNIGEVKARQLRLEVVGDPWKSVVKQYEKAADRHTKAPLGLTESDALIQAQLAYLLRWEDYNAETGEIRLWNPTRLSGLKLEGRKDARFH